MSFNSDLKVLYGIIFYEAIFNSYLFFTVTFKLNSDIPYMLCLSFHITLHQNLCCLVSTEEKNLWNKKIAQDIFYLQHLTCSGGGGVG